MTTPPSATPGGTLTKPAAKTPPSSNGQPSDTNIPLGRLEWARSVRKKLTRLFADRPLSQAQDEWAAYLAERKNVRPLSRVFGGRCPPLLWGLPVSRLDDDSLRLVEALHKLSCGKRSKSKDFEQAVREWLELPRDDSTSQAILALAWSYALPQLVQVVETETWWKLLHALWRTATESIALAESADPLVAQLYGAELPRVLSYQFPELADARTLAKAARQMLSESLPEMLDGQGTPHAARIPIYRALAACWTRCAMISAAADQKYWNREAQTQYEQVVRQLLRMARHDGSQAMTDEPTHDGSACRTLLDAAMRICGNRDDRVLAKLALPGRKSKSKAEAWDAPSMESQWSELAILRKDWSRKSPQLHVTYDGGQTRIELLQGKRTLLKGLHGFQVTLNGKPVARRDDSEWEQVCWESDDDVDYLELEMELDQGIRVQRSYLLLRDDEVLLVSDAVLSLSSGKLRHRTQLALADGVAFSAEEESRDGWLVADKKLARVLPLGLPEWRVDPRVGSLFVQDGSLVLEQDAAGGAAMVPLLLDLKRKQHKREGTWRQLTVAEERQVQPPDVAVGFRAQIGDDQWLVYRSLQPVGMRTVLGHHLNCEFYCGRFSEDGDSEQLLAVE